MGTVKSRIHFARKEMQQALIATDPQYRERMKAK